MIDVSFLFTVIFVQYLPYSQESLWWSLPQVMDTHEHTTQTEITSLTKIHTPRLTDKINTFTYPDWNNVYLSTYLVTDTVISP